MKSERIIAGAVIGAVAALFLIPKTRRMITDAFGQLTDSLKGIADDAKDLAERGTNELSRFAGEVAEKKQAWQS